MGDTGFSRGAIRFWDSPSQTYPGSETIKLGTAFLLGLDLLLTQ